MKRRSKLQRMYDVRIKTWFYSARFEFTRDLLHSPGVCDLYIFVPNNVFSHPVKPALLWHVTSANLLAKLGEHGWCCHSNPSTWRTLNDMNRGSACLTQDCARSRGALRRAHCVFTFDPLTDILSKLCQCFRNSNKYFVISEYVHTSNKSMALHSKFAKWVKKRFILTSLLLATSTLASPPPRDISSTNVEASIKEPSRSLRRKPLR